MKKEDIIEGQINIFELPIIESMKVKENTIKVVLLRKANKLDNIINLSDV